MSNDPRTTIFGLLSEFVTTAPAMNGRLPTPAVIS